MNLIVDIGNTVLKAALCSGITLGKTWRFQGENKVDFVLSIARKTHPAVLVICSANVLSDSETESLSGVCDKIKILDPQHLEILRDAGLPEYITSDCAASIIAARHLFKGKACSIFDFGTMLKSSILDSCGHYVGGNISPGCTTRFRSINRYARNLPMLSETEDTQKLGNSLNSSIRSGIVSGIMFEIEGYINLFPQNVVVFTGGDANYFAKRTKNSIFVVCNLVLKGLALIAEENDEIS